MSDSTDSGSKMNPLDPDGALDAGPDRGQERDVVQDSGSSSAGDGADYVDGNYGDAGRAPSSDPEEEGQYTSGNFGGAGESDTSGAEQEEGDYPEGDYGKAGHDGSAGSSGPGGEEDAEYPEGDYGQAGQVGQEKYPETERPWEGS